MVSYNLIKDRNIMKVQDVVVWKEVNEWKHTMDTWVLGGVFHVSFSIEYRSKIDAWYTFITPWCKIEPLSEKRPYSSLTCTTLEVAKRHCEKRLINYLNYLGFCDEEGNLTDAQISFSNPLMPLYSPLIEDKPIHKTATKAVETKVGDSLWEFVDKKLKEDLIEIQNKHFTTVLEDFVVPYNRADYEVFINGMHIGYFTRSGLPTNVAVGILFNCTKEEFNNLYLFGTSWTTKGAFESTKDLDVLQFEVKGHTCEVLLLN